jgi:hypothetical protein
MTRLEGWEARLEAVLDAYRTRPYTLGHADCLRLACEAIEALTGEAHWHLFRGQYHDEASALWLLGRWGRSWPAAFSAFLGVPPGAPLAARRGDLVTYRDVQPHLGVCVGAQVALYGPAGLAFADLADAGVVESWRIG